MPVEFRCTKCSKLLRTPDDTAGKQARCPECGTILQIPVAAANIAGTLAPHVAAGPAVESLPRPGQYPPPADTSNPYQAPLTASERTALGRQPLRFGAAYGHAWRIFKRQAPLCLAAVIAVAAVNWGLEILVRLIAPQGTFLYTALALPKGLVSVWIGVGQNYFFLKLVGGKSAGIGDLFAGTRWFSAFLGATILFIIAIVVGFLLLFVPGIILTLMLSQYGFLIIDQNCGVLESLRQSRELTVGNKSTLFSIFFVSLLLPIAILSLVGSNAATPLQAEIGATIVSIVTMPWIWLLNAVCYLMMSGQPTADDMSGAGLS